MFSEGGFMVAQNWVCGKCGFVAVDLFPPKRCPKCGSGRKNFKSKGEYYIPDDKIDDIVRVCKKVSYGLYLVSSMDGDKINGQICNTLFQITSNPPRVAIGINHGNLTHDYIVKSGVFAASILGEDDQRMVRRFGYRSGRDFDKFKGVPVLTGETECLVLKNAVGYIECSVLEDKTVDAGTHSIFIGNIVGAKLLNDIAPMTYEYYCKVKNT
jgi:flavin reductase (DIM6/NTAB) family NADH-FMN oxidoreductase RutF